MKKMFFLLIALLSTTIYANVRVGAERMELLLPLLKEKKVALVVNQTSVVGCSQVHLLDTLVSSGIQVMKVFAPEHGFRGDADAGEKVKDGKDVRTGVPILSIYGKTRKPSAEQLSGVDVVVFDIQDVGARFYTYISTMHYVMEACAENGSAVIVCDRPNPNDHVDGPVLQSECKSFLGMHPIPLLHGLTVGELAQMINGEGWLKAVDGNALHCDLTVVRMTGWKHGQAYHLPVKPSPNLPNDCSIQLYPSLCLFEATQLSIGRGTTMPFQVVGGTDRRYGTFSFTPVSLEGWDKAPLNQDKTCYGVDLRDSGCPGGFSLKYFLDFYKRSGNNPNFITRTSHFDLLAGNKVLRRQILSGTTEDAIRKTWEKELADYGKMRRNYLLYE